MTQTLHIALPILVSCIFQSPTYSKDLDVPGHKSVSRLEDYWPPLFGNE